MTGEQIEAKNFGLRAVNPHRRNDGDTRTPKELLALIQEKGKGIAEGPAVLKTRRTAGFWR
ncbi:MAG: hypothetical protein ACUVTG_11805 [Candidatus Oleimicrobiaceae bacterium]